MKLAVTCALATAALLMGCAKPAPAPVPSPPSPAVLEALLGSVAPRHQLGGTVAPLQNVGISSSLSEPASAVLVREGQRVNAGDVLATFDVSDLEAQLDADLRSADEADANATKQRFQSIQTIVAGVGNSGQAQATLTQAQTKLSLDRVTLQRDEQLLAQQFIARQTVDEARQTVEADVQQIASAQAALTSARGTVVTNGSTTAGLQGASIVAARAAAAAARAQAEQVRAQISRATLRSPIDGIVVSRNLNVAEYPGTRTLFTIQQRGDAYAVLNASSDEVQGLRPGAGATVTVPGNGLAAVRGRVEAVLAQAQPGATNFTVKVRLPNASGALLAGMAVTATIDAAAVTGVRIPRSAFTDGSETTVVTVRADRTQLQPVSVVAEDDGHAIVRGISSGARIIANGNAGYTSGQIVAAR
jgi:multidrug efflux pump subunit AcrA (membrane-fusion protein)